MRRINNKQKWQPGFTIIEVMIVLAVAGLIMVIVFLAVPQLRLDARNSHRKALANLVFSDMKEYVADNDGTFPKLTTSWAKYYDKYIKGNLNDRDPTTGVSIFGPPPPNSTDKPEDIDPDYCRTAVIGDPCASMDSCTGNDETYTIPCVNNLPDSGYARIVFNAKCSGEQLVSANGDPRNDDDSGLFALVMGLEPSGVVYCIDS